MFEKNMRIAYLLDFYGEALDEHTGSVMRYYYDDDMSLSEVASFFGISRQGVRHLIKKGEEELEFLESKLGLAERYVELSRICEELSEIESNLRASEGHTEDADRLERIRKSILKGNQDVPKSD